MMNSSMMKQQGKRSREEENDGNEPWSAGAVVVAGGTSSTTRSTIVPSSRRRITRASGSSSSSGTNNNNSNPFEMQVTSIRQQLIQRENMNFQQFQRSIRLSPNGEVVDLTAEQANRIIQLVAESNRIFRNIDMYYPDRNLEADLVAMGNDDCCALGIKLNGDDIIIGGSPPAIVRHVPGKSIVGLACGGTHSVALHKNGTVYTFGSNDEGQSGRYDLDNEENYKSGQVVKDPEGKHLLMDIVQVAAGDCHSLFKDIHGKVYMVGQYKDTDSGLFRPMPIGSPDESIRGKHTHAFHIELPGRAKFIASGLNFSAAVLPDTQGSHIVGADTLYTWGMGQNGANGRSKSMGCPTKTETREVEEAGGGVGTITYETYESGKKFTGNYYKKTEIDQNGEEKVIEWYEYDLKKVQLFLKPSPVDWAGPKIPRQVLSVALGELHMLVVAREGNERDGTMVFAPRVYSTGNSGFGQGGHGDLVERNELTPIKALDGMMIGKVAAGARHSLALDMYGQNVYGWGDSGYGKTGLFENESEAFVKTPQPVAFPTDLGDTRIVNIAAGDLVSFAITQDGECYSWGFGEEMATGQRGEDDINRPKLLNVMRKIPKTPEGGNTCKVLAVDGGGQHSLMLIKRYTQN